MFVFGFLSFLIILNLQFDWSSAETDYCDICGDHTMCLYPDDEPASSCGDIIDPSLSEGEKTVLLNGHNEFRQKVAGGNETRGHPGPQPAATDMKELEWDDELAMIAQRWAEQCEGVRDSCRDVERFSVGQNVASYDERKSRGIPTVSEQMETWFNEVDAFDNEDVSSYGYNSNTTEYTQVIWASTTHLGCGRTVSSFTGRYYTAILVCNYGIKGNVDGKPVYMKSS